MHLISKFQFLMILLICGIPLGNVMAETVLLSDDFEQSSLGSAPKQTATSKWGKCSGNCTEVTAEKSRNGGRSLKTYLHRYNSSPAYRTEAVPRSLGKIAFKTDYWYGFSVYIPPNTKPDHTKNVDTLAQWHAVTPGNRGGPPLSIQLYGNNWRVASRSNTTKNGKQNSAGFSRRSWDLGAYSQGKWTDWVIHTRWSSGKDGILEIWKNGKKVVSYNGPNAYNDGSGPFLKIGLYKPRWRNSNDKLANPNITSRTFYHDAIKAVKGADATYADVDPAKNRGGSSNKIEPPKNIKIISNN